MALEAVIFQQDPFIYGCKDYNYNMGFSLLMAPQDEEKPKNPHHQNHGNWDNPTSSVAQNTTSFPDTCGAGDGFLSPAVAAPVVRRNRRRSRKSFKNKEEMENQRMTHIAVERNRRRQMNDYLAILRSLMPPSYAQRGDQASIVGGAINFVKELEQLLQFLEAHHKPANQPPPNNSPLNLFSNFFTFPQYSTSPSNATAAVDAVAARQSGLADIEVTMVESHANIKILTKRRPKHLFKMVAGFQSIGLTILHLNITTVDQSVLFSFNVKVEDECHLSTVNEIATTVHDIVGMIQEDYVTAPTGDSSGQI